MLIAIPSRERLSLNQRMIQKWKRLLVLESGCCVDFVSEGREETMMELLRHFYVPRKETTMTHSKMYNLRITCVNQMLSLQGLFVPFARIGSSDPVRVLRLYTTNTLDTIEAFIAETYVQLATTEAMCYSTGWSALACTNPRAWLTLRTVLCGELYSCLCRR